MVGSGMRCGRRNDKTHSCRMHGTHRGRRARLTQSTQRNKTNKPREFASGFAMDLFRLKVDVTCTKMRNVIGM